MLARVASNLFWIGRYIERAENTARLLDMGRRMSALPGTEGNRNEWGSILASSGSESYYPSTEEKNRQIAIVEHLVTSPNNPSSVYSCLRGARESMRSTREGLSMDCWSAMNSVWLDFKEIAAQPISSGALADVIDRIKFACMTVNGAVESTVLRNETYDFLKLGTFTERADSTARILDVKYFSLLPPEEQLEGGVDTVQWMTILEATSTRRHFRRLYGADLRAATVVELLVQNQQCARSLAFCYSAQLHHFEHINKLNGGLAMAAARSNQLFTSVLSADIQDVLAGGLHEYLGECIRANNAVADQISLDFHFLPHAAPPTSTKSAQQN